MSEDTPQEMHALSRIFHLKAQNEPSLVQTRVKAKGQETSSDFVVSFGSLEQSWNLRETDCVFEWKVFLSCVVGFSPLLPTPGFRVASRK